MVSAESFLPAVLLNNKNEKIDSSSLKDLKAICLFFCKSSYPENYYNCTFFRFYNHVCE